MYTLYKSHTNTPPSNHLPHNRPILSFNAGRVTLFQTLWGSEITQTNPFCPTQAPQVEVGGHPIVTHTARVAQSYMVAWNKRIDESARDLRLRQQTPTIGNKIRLQLNVYIYVCEDISAMLADVVFGAAAGPSLIGLLVFFFFCFYFFSSLLGFMFFFELSVLVCTFIM